MTLTDKGFLDKLLELFKSKCIAGIDLLTPEVFYLLIALGTIEIAMCAMLSHDEDKFQLLIKRILKIGFFYFLIENWKDLTIDQVFETFKMAGIVASGADNFILTPSEIVSAGIKLTAGVLGDVVGTYGWLALFTIGILLLKILISFIILAAFGFMAIQLFLVTVEFYVMTISSYLRLPILISSSYRNWTVPSI